MRIKLVGGLDDGKIIDRSFQFTITKPCNGPPVEKDWASELEEHPKISSGVKFIIEQSLIGLSQTYEISGVENGMIIATPAIKITAKD